MSLSEQDILEIFKKTEALLEGHFLLTSGRHSNVYFQCAKVLQYPSYMDDLGDNTRSSMAPPCSRNGGDWVERRWRRRVHRLDATARRETRTSPLSICG